MVARVGRSRVLQLLTLGSAGVLAGHALDYLLVQPDSAHRHQVLRDTGHGYMSGLTAPIAAAAAAALLAAFAVGAARGRDRRGARPKLSRLAPALALSQASAFVAVEVAERLASGAGLRDLAGRVLVLGLVLQLVVGALGAALLIVLDRGGERLGAAIARLRRPAVAAPSRFLLPPARRRPARPCAGAAGLRSPPPVLVSTRS